MKPSKYEPLKKHLEKLSVDSEKLSYKDVEKILGFKLPKSAFNHREWWANTTSSHPYAKSWLEVGWLVKTVYLRKAIEFRRNSLKDKMKNDVESSDWVYTDEWFYEKKVRNKIIRFMKEVEHFNVFTDPNQDIYRQGPDIEAERDGEKWVVEIKGYPSDKYTRDSPGGKKGEIKRTKPNSQARHWFDEALVQVLKSICKHRQKKQIIHGALGFTTHPIYKQLSQELAPALENFNIHIYFVDEKGVVNHLKTSDL